VQPELLMMGGVSTKNMYSVIAINKLRKVTFVGCIYGIYLKMHGRMNVKKQVSS
jgi:hypothetical protein